MRNLGIYVAVIADFAPSPIINRVGIASCIFKIESAEIFCPAQSCHVLQNLVALKSAVH